MVGYVSFGKQLLYLSTFSSFIRVGNEQAVMSIQTFHTSDDVVCRTKENKHRTPHQRLVIRHNVTYSTSKCALFF